MSVVESFAAYVAAYNALQSEHSSQNARALVRAAEVLDEAGQDLPLWAYDGIRHTTIAQMGEQDRVLAGVADENW
jgi:hypothetical protein